MEVYIVLEGEYMEGTSIEGVFSTATKAVTAANRKNTELHNMYQLWGKEIKVGEAYFDEDDIDFITVEEYEVK